MRFVGYLLQLAVLLFLLDLVQYIVPLFVLGYLRWLAHWFLCFNLAIWIITLTEDYFYTATVDPKNKAVLITGCDTGFGNAFARILDKKGYKVIAGCLDATCDGAMDLKEKCHGHLKLVQMDVTDDGSVENSVQFVKENLGNSELWAIINNAGVLNGFHTEFSRMKDYDMCMQVNALGMVRVTRAFLPLLRKSRGRVVNMCSLAGRTRSAFLGAYMMSKSAAVAFTEVLTREMREFGIKVISIEPEFFRTPLCAEENILKNLNQSMSETTEEIKSAYGSNYLEKARDIYKTVLLNSSPNVEYVYNAVESAVSLQNPSDIYVPRRNIYVKTLFMLYDRVPVVTTEIVLMLVFLVMGLPSPKTGFSILHRLIKM